MLPLLITTKEERVDMLTTIIFVGLNITDAFPTKTALELGAIEGNLSLLAVSCGANILIRALFAIAVVIFLYWRGRERILWGINFIIFGVVLWNLFICELLRL